MALAGSGLHALHSRKVTADRWLFEIDVLFYLESLLCDVFDVDCTSGSFCCGAFLAMRATVEVGKLEDIIAEQPSPGHFTNLCGFEFQDCNSKRLPPPIYALLA
jgi:hypothetical protein